MLTFFCWFSKTTPWLPANCEIARLAFPSRLQFRLRNTIESLSLFSRLQSDCASPSNFDNCSCVNIYSGAISSAVSQAACLCGYKVAVFPSFIARTTAGIHQIKVKDKRHSNSSLFRFRFVYKKIKVTVRFVFGTFV